MQALDISTSQINMVTDVYSHIIDEGRWKNAQKLEDAFYGKQAEVSSEPPVNDKSKQLLELINQNPDLAEILLQTLSTKK